MMEASDNTSNTAEIAPSRFQHGVRNHSVKIGDDQRWYQPIPQVTVADLSITRHQEKSFLVLLQLADSWYGHEIISFTCLEFQIQTALEIYLNVETPPQITCWRFPTRILLRQAGAALFKVITLSSPGKSDCVTLQVESKYVSFRQNNKVIALTSDAEKGSEIAIIF